MPAFEYKGLDCHNKYSLTLPVIDDDKTKVKYPKCGRRKMEEQCSQLLRTGFIGSFN